LRRDPNLARDLFREIDSQIDSLAVKWQTFDLEAKRDEIRARAGVEKQPEMDAPR